MNHKFFIRILKNGLLLCSKSVLFLLFGIVSFSAEAQNGTCFQLYMPVLAAQPGDTVCVPIRVRDFESIVSMQFTTVWDTAALEAINLDVDNVDLPAMGLSNLNIFQQRVLCAWFDPQAVGVTVPDGGTLFSICFKVKTLQPGLYPVQILNSAEVFYEIVDGTLNEYMPYSVQNGGIQVGGGVSDLHFESSCIKPDSCIEHIGSVFLEILGGQPPYNFTWTGPGQFESTTQNISGLGAGEYHLIVSDAAGNILSGAFEVRSISADFYAYIYVTPAFCDQSNGCATVTVFGDPGPLTYAWSLGGATGAENCNLPPGQHTVSLTDAGGCTVVRSFTISNQAPASVYISVTNVNTCGGTGSATANVFPADPPGGYGYLWSNGATTKTVNGLSPGIYTVTVTANGGCEMVKSAQVYDVSSYYWYAALETECDPGLSGFGALHLTYNPAADMTFPVVVSWSDGTTREIPGPTGNNSLDTLSGVPSGQYSVLITDSAGCQATVNKTLFCAAPPAVPDSLPAFYIQDDYLTLQYAVDSCLGVYARNFYNLSEINLTLKWYDNAMDIREIRQLNLPGMTYGDFDWTPGTGKLQVAWQAPGGPAISMPSPSLLFEVCYDPLYPGDYTSVVFSDDPQPPSVKNATGNELGFIGKNGYVLFGLYFPLPSSVCNYGLIPPDCTADGFGRIVLEKCNANKALNGSIVHNGVYTTDLVSLMFADQGSYSISAWQTNLGSNQFFAYVPFVQDSADCVWPGDADNNNAVNHHDLLYLGLAYGQQGLPRGGASLDWHGQSAADWVQQTDVRPVNFKNIDTNGDGAINAADTLAIVQNWGSVINPTRDNPFNAPLIDTLGLSNAPLITLPSDTLAPGEEVLLPLSVGSASMPVDSVYGLAFSISYDPTVVNPASVAFHPAASWLGDPATNLIWVQRNFPGQGRLDVAITRTDGQPVSGNGPIGETFIVIEDNIFLRPTENEAATELDTLRKTKLFFSATGAVNAAGQGQYLNGPPVNLVIRKGGSSSAFTPGAWADAVRISPNPATEMVHVSSPEADIERLEVLDATGRVVLTEACTGGSGYNLEVRSLRTGVYFLRIFTKTGIAVRNCAIMR